MFDPDLVTRTCGYHPILQDSVALAGVGVFGQALVVGSNVPDISGLVPDVRLHVVERVGVPEGCYWFTNLDVPVLLVISQGAAPGDPHRVAPEDLTEVDPLAHVLGWYQHWLQTAIAVPTPRFESGAEVMTVSGGQDSVVRKRSFQSGSWYYEVRLDGRLQTLAERNLDVLPGEDDPCAWIRAEVAPAARFAATLTRTKLEGAFTDTLFSFRATRTLFRPYQFRPVMKLLETGQLRLLVADEVGLGKTIEAGLLWTELEARRLADRVLVLCPSSLVNKWQREMEDRFSFELKELTGSALDEFADRLASDRLPPRFHYICSVERMRAWSGLENLAELRPSFDLVIVDEAHSFRNVGTKSNALGGLVSEWAEALVFLSATPLNLRNQDLYNLLELLVPGEFEDQAILEQRLEPNAVFHRVSASLFDSNTSNEARLSWLDKIEGMAFGPAVVNRPEYLLLRQVLTRAPNLTPETVVQAKRLMRNLHALSAAVTRTRKVEVHEDKALRSARRETVQWTEQEANFYSAYYEWCRVRAQAANSPIGFAMQMPLRLASTCLQVAKHQVLRWSDALEITDEDDEEASARPIPAAPAIRPHAELVALAGELGQVDSKLTIFKRVIAELVGSKRQVLVFTFSRPTLAYLELALRRDHRVAVLHGGVGKDARLRIMADFRAGNYDVVLANRVASEGLDFEFCSAVVNYDLPWNPMEIEQRIGRIDRIGQTEEKIFVVNFHTPQTIEGDILQRVMDRIGVFEHSIGELEPIVQSHLADLQRTVFDFELSTAERERRSDEILAAIEEKGQTQSEVEDATAYLMSSDGVEIEGLEASLVDRGRYVGQVELSLLLDDWSRTTGGQGVKRSRDNRGMRLRGNPAMAEHVDALVRLGERSRAEVESLAAQLRSESEIHVSLDQEWSRTGGPDLITANHPLVRAAMRVPGHRLTRFAALEVEGSDLAAGRYIVLVAVALWRGLRPGREIWTQVVDVAASRAGDPAVGDLVLAQLATGQLKDGHSSPPDALVRAVEEARTLLVSRVAIEEQRRRAENEALIQTRLISLREVSERKRAQIRTRIETLIARDRNRMIPLQAAQIERDKERLAAALSAVELARNCGMSLENIAVCEVSIHG